MPLSAVQPGMACTGKTVLQGTQISDFALSIVDVVGTGGDARILARASGPGVDATGVAQGFSGSPVYCPFGDGTAIAGAVSAGTGDYGNLLVLVTPIETMLAEPTTGVPSPASLGALTVTGVTGPVAAALRSAAKRKGRQLVVAPGAPRALALAPQTTLVPGSSVGVGYSTGAIAASAIGTVTYVDGNRIWAFGHPLDGAGKRQLLLQGAYVHAVVGNPLTLEGSTPYKLASPLGAIGTLTDDRLAGISGVLGTLPRTFPLTVSVRNTETGKLTVEKTELTDEVALGSPDNALGEIAPIAVAQATVNALNGAPAQMVARMCVRIRLVGRTKPIKFCNRYVGGGGAESPGGGMPIDMAAAAGLLAFYDRTPIHVADVDVQIRAAQKPGTADIRKVTVTPRRARPGSRVLVRVEAVLSGSGDRIVRERRVRVPGGYDAGDVLRVDVEGRSADTSGGLDSLDDILSIFSGPSDGNSEDAPRTIDQLASSIEKIAGDDRARISIGDLGVRLPLLNVDDVRLTGFGGTTLTVRR